MDSALTVDDDTSAEARGHEVRTPFDATRWFTDRVVPCVVILVEFTLLHGGHLAGLMCATRQLLDVTVLGIEWMTR